MAKIVIIGGGAAGMAAGIFLGEQGHRVHILEKNEKLGKKLFITGKGRCNLTNSCDEESFFQSVVTNPKFLYSAFYGYTNQDTIAFFESLGLKVKEERGGRIFPVSDHSSDVIRVMEKRLRELDVKIHLNSQVQEILTGEAETEGRKVQGAILENGARIEADRVIVATGGYSYQATGSTGDGYRLAGRLGHTVTPTMPSLTALVPEKYNFALIGLTLRNVSLSLLVDGGVVQTEFGELTFTDGGLEGALGFRVSRRAVKALTEGKKVEAVIDLKPAVPAAELKARVEREYRPGLGLDRFLERFLPLQAVRPFIEAAPSLTVQNLPVRLKNWRMPIKSFVDYRRAVVTAGGVSLKEISRKTMESKLVPGLYFAGEVMDLDADTGGYNLQIAFSTAAAAVRSVINRSTLR